MVPRRDPLLRLISTLSLLADTKAISLPEKKADSKRKRMIVAKEVEDLAISNCLMVIKQKGDRIEVIGDEVKVF